MQEQGTRAQTKAQTDADDHDQQHHDRTRDDEDGEEDADEDEQTREQRMAIKTDDEPKPNGAEMQAVSGMAMATLALLFATI